MKEKKRKVGLIEQVAVLFLVGILSTGLITYVCEKRLSGDSVTEQTEIRAGELAGEVRQAVMEYPAYGWLIRYWYDHPDTLDIEYDAPIDSGTRTAEKCREFSGRHPELLLRYLDEQQCEALSAEDQKLYAEIAYSWLITRIDEIKRANHIAFLFCVISEEPFDGQFFLFSGADEGAVRGTAYEEVYPLGHTVSVNESQSEAMREAVRNTSHLADAGIYVDYYSLLCSFDEHSVLIGLTYDVSNLRSDIERKTRTESTLAILNQVVLSLICLLLLSAFVLYPLRKVQGYIRRYKETKDSKEVAAGLAEVRSHNEVRELAEDVSDMIREIDTHVEKISSITAEKERISTELTLATRIQAAMLPNIFPPFPDRTEFDIYASMDPAKEVGGDFYDFFMIDDDHLAVVIADVSGKGVPAALFMMISKILVKNYAMTGLSPAGTLDAVNRQICANNKEDMFVTVWIGILEISTGKITAANAGHEYPVLKTAGGRFELLKDKHSLCVGAMDGVPYRDYELSLTPGARLFVYTDGVPEAADADDEMFGTERMLDVLNSEPEGASSEQILRGVRQAVDRFIGGAEQFDDLTMLCLEYRGPSGSGSAEELTIGAEIGNLEAVQSFIGEALEKLGCPVKVLTQVDVAAEEIFVNIAHYAYAPGKGDATVRVEKADPAGAVITFADRGVPYDPTSKEDPDTALPAEEREIGGLGIFMTKKIMDEMTYERRDGMNILKMRKNF